MTLNIEPYEFMKLFLLNVTHSCVAYAGLECGFVYVHEAMNDDHLRTELLEMVNADIFPILAVHIPEAIDWNEYWHKTVNRFRNEHMHDTLERISRDGLEKLKKQGLRLYSEGKKIGLPMEKFKRYLDLWATHLGVTLESVMKVNGVCEFYCFTTVRSLSGIELWMSQWYCARSTSRSEVRPSKSFSGMGPDSRFLAISTF